MSDRTMKTIVCPSGKQVVIKESITARERNTMRAVVLGGVSIDPQNPVEPKISQLTGDIVEKMSNTAIEQVVSSFDGSSDNVLERILDGTPEDYDFIISEVNKIANFQQAK